MKAISALVSWFRSGGGEPLLDLDRPLDESRLWSPDDPEDALAHLRSTVARLLSGTYGAVYAFYHEADDVVRMMLWRLDDRVWVEEIPIPGAVGRRFLAELRRQMRTERRDGPRRQGLIAYRSGGRAGWLRASSPHECEFRVVVDQEPPHLPYVLVNAEMKRINEQNGSG
jgi:hypothetical protein